MEMKLVVTISHVLVNDLIETTEGDILFNLSSIDQIPKCTDCRKVLTIDC